MDPRYDVIDDAARLAHEFLDGLPERPVGERATLDELRERLGRDLTDTGEDPGTVIADLAAEAVAAGWVRELLGLPAGCGLGFVTGCQMAHFTCLAAARHTVLRDAGWDV